MKQVIAVMGMLLALTAAVQAKTYTVGTHHWIGFSANDVADVKGFWKKQGLDVRLINFTSEKDACNALVNRRVDLAYQMMGTWIGFYMEGSPITLIAEVDWSHGGDKVIVKKDMDIQKLKGRPFGVYVDNPAVLFFLHQYLAANALSVSDVQIIGGLEAKELADSFIFGRINGLVLYNPEAIRAQKEGNGKVVGTTASYPGCMPEGIAMRTDALKSIPPEDFSKIFKGWLEAVRWMGDKANWEEYKKILNSRTFEGDPPYSDSELREMYEGVRIHDADMLKERNKDRGGFSVWLREMKTMLKDSGRLAKDFDPDKIFDNTAIRHFLEHSPQ